MNFGEQLKKLRTEHGLTQLDLARILDVSKSNISKYEAGTVEPNLSLLQTISSYFNVSIDSLLKNNDLIGTKEKNMFFFFFDDVLKSVFTKRLNEIITCNHLTEENFAKLLSFDEDRAFSYLRGDKEPSLEDLIEIAQKLNVSIDYLLGQIDPKANDLMNTFRKLKDEDDKDIILGDAKRFLREQRLSSVAADNELRPAK